MRVVLAVVAAAAAALQLLNSRVEGSRSVESAYDTNIGVFSPQGRLLQLDYVEGLVKRGNLCMGVECKDGVVLMTNKLVTADAAKLLVDGGVRRIYRVDSHIGLLPAGLPADGRALAHKAIEYCRSHRREFGEPMPGRLLAERLGEFLHAGIVRWGSRAYPNALFVACWERPQGGPTEEKEGGEREGEGDEDAGFQLYVVDPSGSSRRHRAACTGRGSSRARKWLHRRAAAADACAAAAAAAAGPGVATPQQGGTREGGGRDPAGEPKDKRNKRSLWAEPPTFSTAAGARDQEDGEEEDDDSEDSEERGSEADGSDDDDDDDDEVEDDDEDDDDEDDDDSRAETKTANQKRSRGGGGRRRPRGERRRQRQQQRLPLSQMTCVEAARALVEEARRVRAGGPGKAGAGAGGADAPGDVASLPEVAWLTIARKAGKDRKEEDNEEEDGEAEPLFVHHLSMEKLSGKEQAGEVG